jgi:hypothetical protein
MIQLESYTDHIARICREWNKAEEDIKLAEQVCAKVVLPSVKELRYAGRRIVEALNEIGNNGDQKRIRNLFQDAEFDCHRARHDAIDAATSNIAQDLDIAVRKLGYNAILPAFQKFTELRKKLNAVREKIAKSRGAREKREEIYSSIEDQEFPYIVSLFREFQENEEIMKGLARKQRWLEALAIMGIVIGGLGLISGAVFYFLSRL